MNLFNLFAKLTLDKSDYEKNIEEAKQEGDKFSKDTERKIGIISANAWVQLAKEVVNVGKFIASTTLQLVDYADKYGDLSAKYDISTQSLQEFEYIASQNGATLESVLSTMTMMYNRAKEGDEVFDKLGISVKDTNGNMKSMVDLFWETKTAIDQVDNSGDQSALMLEAFGRNAMSLGEILRRDTGELRDMADKAHELGIVMSEEVIDSAGAFNDMLDEMKLRGQSAFAEFFMGAEGSSEKVDEFLNEITDKIEDYTPKFLEIGLKLGWSLVKGIFKGVGNLLSGVWNWITGSEGEENTKPNTTQLLSDTQALSMGSYSTTETKQTMDINIKATGDSEISQENASLIASQLIPYIDKKLGEV